MKKTTVKKPAPTTTAPKKDSKEKTMRVKLEDELLKQATGGGPVRWKTSS